MTASVLSLYSIDQCLASFSFILSLQTFFFICYCEFQTHDPDQNFIKGTPCTTSDYWFSCKGNYHCMYGLLFDLCGIECWIKYKINQIYLFSLYQTGQTGNQPCSDSSLIKVNNYYLPPRSSIAAIVNLSFSLDRGGQAIGS